MCGFAGLFARASNRLPDRNELSRMVGAIAHRGPDGTALHLEPSVGLGFCRLSIIDVAGGMQPLSNEDGTVWLAFNGEIYNFRELRAALEQKGHVFRTQTDSEVIVHGYEEWGEDCPGRLRGIFAFAVWDRPRRRLFLARDHSGVKPLYLLHHRDELRFASEAKALWADPEVPRRIDLSGCFFSGAGQQALEPTAFAGIQELSAGCSLLVTPEREATRRYWRYEPTLSEQAAEGVTEDSLIEAFRDELAKVTQMQIMSDVPVGAYLSGGVDSAAVVAAMHRAGLKNLATYTTVFDDPESNDPYFSAMVAKHTEVSPHFIRCPSGAETLASVPFIAWAAEGDFDLGYASRYLLARAAREDGVKVILTGQGIDEILTGYHPDFARFLHAAGRAELEVKAAGTGRQPLAHLIAEERIARELQGSEAERTVAKLQADHAGLARYLLRFEDRMGMAAGVEVRVPMLDHRLLELCAGIPQALRAPLLSGKSILRRAVSPWLPAEVTQRAKFAFNSSALPITQLMAAREGGLGGEDELCTLLNYDVVSERGYFDPDEVAHLVRTNRFRSLDGVLIVHLLDELFVQGKGYQRFVGAPARPSIERLDVGAVARRRPGKPKERPTLEANDVARFCGPVTGFQCVYRVDQASNQMIDPEAILTEVSVPGRPSPPFAGDATTLAFLRLVDGKRSYAEIARALEGNAPLDLVLEFAGALTQLGVLERPRRIREEHPPVDTVGGH